MNLLTDLSTLMVVEVVEGSLTQGLVEKMTPSKWFVIMIGPMWWHLNGLTPHVVQFWFVDGASGVLIYRS